MITTPRKPNLKINISRTQMFAGSDRYWDLSLENICALGDLKKADYLQAAKRDIAWSRRECSNLEQVVSDQETAAMNGTVEHRLYLPSDR
jgi:hypothetical protein